MIVSTSDIQQDARLAVLTRGTAVGLIVLFFGDLLLCLLIFNKAGFVSHMMSSDTLLPIMFIWDLRHHGYALSGFQLARIPSFVPDLALTGLLAVILNNARWVQFTYSLVQSFIFFITAGLVISKATGGRFVDAAALLLMVVTGVLFTDFRFPPIGHHIALFTSMEHFGAFLTSIVALLLVFPLLAQWRWSAAIGLCVCSFFGFLSNRLFAFDFGFPALAGLLILWCCRMLPPRRGVAIIVCAGLGFLLATIADQHLFRQADVPIVSVPDHLALFVVETAAYLEKNHVSAIVSLLIPSIVLIAAPLGWLRARSSPSGNGGAALLVNAANRVPIFVWTFAATATVGVIAIGAAIYVDAGSYRYFTAPLFWPLVWLTLSLLPLLRRFIGPLSFAYLPIMVAGIWATAGPAGFVPGTLRWEDPLATCLMKQRQALGLRAGLAEYWVARPATVASSWSIQIDQVTGGGDLYQWGNDRFWYEQSFGDPTKPPQYNFIVMKRMDEPAVKSKYGEPDRVAICDGFTLWIYNDWQALRRKLLGVAN
jgi:hypothetical protein